MQKAHKAYVMRTSPSQIDTWAMPNNSNRKFLQKDSNFGLLTFCLALSKKSWVQHQKALKISPSF